MGAQLDVQALPGWWEDAACLKADPEQFFPEKGVSPRSAKLVCNGDDTRPPCPVRAACLDYALDNNEQYGVYGGLTERERRRLKRVAT